MKKHHLIMLFIIVLIITGATVVIAKPDGIMRHHGKPEFSPLSQINLSDEQAEEIRKLRMAHEKSISPLRLQEHQVKTELDIFWLQITPDIEKITSAQKKIHNIKFQILEKETNFRIAIREVLTKDQLSRFLALGGDTHRSLDEFNRRPPRPQQ